MHVRHCTCDVVLHPCQHRVAGAACMHAHSHANNSAHMVYSPDLLSPDKGLETFCATALVTTCSSGKDSVCCAPMGSVAVWCCRASVSVHVYTETP